MTTIENAQTPQELVQVFGQIVLSNEDFEWHVVVNKLYHIIRKERFNKAVWLPILEQLKHLALTGLINSIEQEKEESFLNYAKVLAPIEKIIRRIPPEEVKDVEGNNSM